VPANRTTQYNPDDHNTNLHRRKRLVSHNINRTSREFKSNVYVASSTRRLISAGTTCMLPKDLTKSSNSMGERVS
jgi:hypothetical protein